MERYRRVQKGLGISEIVQNIFYQLELPAWRAVVNVWGNPQTGYLFTTRLGHRLFGATSNFRMIRSFFRNFINYEN